jgi:hypothetical protein
LVRRMQMRWCTSSMCWPARVELNAPCWCWWQSLHRKLLSCMRLCMSLWCKALSSRSSVVAAMRYHAALPVPVPCAGHRQLHDMHRPAVAERWCTGWYTACLDSIVFKVAVPDVWHRDAPYAHVDVYIFFRLLCIHAMRCSRAASCWWSPVYGIANVQAASGRRFIRAAMGTHLLRRRLWHAAFVHVAKVAQPGKCPAAVVLPCV